MNSQIRIMQVLILGLLAVTMPLIKCEAPVKLIIDTDMGFDVDDVGALCVAHALQDMNETEILLVIHNTGFRLGAGAISSIR